MSETDLAERIARRVAELLAEIRPDRQVFNRREAAEYCGLTVRTFDRERRRVPGDLAPVGTAGPLLRRWRRDTLDLYLFAGGRLRRSRNISS